ncbi:hypothetical protein GIB67_037439 [Kingdonia uniflora]|uniref:Calponin-homology (CH) domain-containing protein n=1 Tax=Kingdonia uniflora TaxID=39325 RepID=A0A7J7NIC9_9MAGN|nr:hypothetical protein GIB67_037439 [Kingdonia uniflora]
MEFSATEDDDLLRSSKLSTGYWHYILHPSRNLTTPHEYPGCLVKKACASLSLLSLIQYTDMSSPKKTMGEFRGWSHLSADLLQHINQMCHGMLHINNHLIFTRVCSHWRAIALRTRHILPRQQPFVLLQGNKVVHRFLNPFTQEKYGVPLKHNIFCGSIGDSLFSIDYPSGNFTITRVPSCTSLEMPPLPSFKGRKGRVCKILFSSDPYSSNRWVAMCVTVSKDVDVSIRYCRQGDYDWKDIDETLSCSDFLYYNGQFVVSDYFGSTKAVRISYFSSHPNYTVIAVPPEGEELLEFQQVYLVEYGGALYSVCQVLGESHNTYELYELDTARRQWVEVKRLDNVGFYVGVSHSVAFDIQGFFKTKSCLIFDNERGITFDLDQKTEFHWENPFKGIWVTHSLPLKPSGFEAAEQKAYLRLIKSYFPEDPFWACITPRAIYSASYKTGFYSGKPIFCLLKKCFLLFPNSFLIPHCSKLINIAVPGTIEERAIEMNRDIAHIQRIGNHTLCLNSAKAIGCPVSHIGVEDFLESRPKLVLEFIFQVIKMKLLADISFEKTPQLMQIVDTDKGSVRLAPEKLLLEWINYHLKRARPAKRITNFSVDLKDGVAYAYLLCGVRILSELESILNIEDHTERVKFIYVKAENQGLESFVTAKDIISGSPNLNLIYVANVFHYRNGFSVSGEATSSMKPDDLEVSTDERFFRMWINTLGIRTYVNYLFADVKNGWVLLEVSDKIRPGSVKWHEAIEPPLDGELVNWKQAVTIWKPKNISGNDIVERNKKCIQELLWLMMQSHMLVLLKSARFIPSNVEEITAIQIAIVKWANNMVKRKDLQIQTLQDKSLSSGIFLLELLSAVEPAINWNGVKCCKSDAEKEINASYVLSLARKLGCSIFLYPRDIIEVNEKMIFSLIGNIISFSGSR